MNPGKSKNQLRGVMPLLFTGVLMGALDISIVGPAIPSIEEALQISSRSSGWIFSIYVLFNLVGISLFARLSDIYGRRKIYALAVVIFAAGSLLVALSTSTTMLLTGRAVQGFGASGIFPVASAVIGDLYPVEKRGRLLGMLGAVFGLAFMIGPFMAGVLLKYFSWNSLFMINLPVSVFLVYFSLRLLPSERIANSVKIDWKGIIFLGLFLLGFAFGINNIEWISEGKWGSVLIILSFLLSALSLGLLIIFEKKAAVPIIKLAFFRNRVIFITGVIAAVTGLIQASFVFIPKFSVETFAVSSSKASFMLIPFVVATALGSPVFGRMIDKFGVKPILVLGIILNLAGFSLMSVNGENLYLYYISGELIGLGLSVLAGSSLRYIMLNAVGPEDRAVSQGMLTIFTSSGQLIGSALFGFILGGFSVSVGFRYLFLTAAFALLFALIMSLRLKFETGSSGR